MHLFLELTTLAFFLLTVAHAVARRGRIGVSIMAALLLLGFVRETFVVLYQWLYGYAELHLMLGKTPVIASIIWAYSIYIAVVWAEGITGQELRPAPPGVAFLGACAAFMICLVGFYEPFLELVGMAKWEEGTRRTLGVPWIALVGYPTLTVPFLAGWSAIAGRFRDRPGSPWGQRSAMVTFVIALAFVHAWGLQLLKSVLGW